MRGYPPLASKSRTVNDDEVKGMTCQLTMAFSLLVLGAFLSPVSTATMRTRHRTNVPSMPALCYGMPHRSLAREPAVPANPLKGTSKRLLSRRPVGTKDALRILSRDVRSEPLGGEFGHREDVTLDSAQVDCVTSGRVVHCCPLLLRFRLIRSTLSTSSFFIAWWSE